MSDPRTWSRAGLAAGAALLLAACGAGTSAGSAGGATPAAGDPPAPGASATASDEGATTGGTFAFEHSAGTTEVPVDPQRIVTTTDQNALLPLLELGVTPVASAGLVGDDGERSFRRVEGYDTTGIEFVGAYGEANLEAIAAQRPDLIVGYEFDESYDDYSRIAPTVLVQIFDRPLTEALLDLGELVGEEEQAQERLQEYEARVAELQEALEPVRDRLSVSVVTNGDAGQFYRGDDGQAVGTVMADLDLLRPEPQSTPYESGEYSLEQVSEHDADVVVVLDFSGERSDPTLQAFLDAPLVQGLAAARADQLHVVDGTRTVGAAWGKMDAFLDELERVLVTEQPDPDVVAD